MLSASLVTGSIRTKDNMKLTTLLLIATCFTCTGCTLFQKNIGTDEMAEMTKQVLDDEDHEGISIEVKPIQRSKG